MITPERRRFNFTIRRNLNDTMLSIDYYKVGSYPLTYSTMDCLEHFCDWAGWELVSLRYGYEGVKLIEGSVTMNRHSGCSFGNVFNKAESLMYRTYKGLL